MTVYWSHDTIVARHGEEAWEVDKPFALIGSHPSCDIQLADTQAPRVCSYIQAIDGGLYCLPLGDDQSDRGWITADRMIHCGDRKFAVGLGSEANTTSTRDSGERGTLEANIDATVRLSRQGQELATRELTAPLTILGRSKPSAIRIRSPVVSRVHCVLYWDTDLLWIIDLCSSNGIRRNGQSTGVAALSPGESIDIDELTLTYAAPQHASESVPIPTPAKSAVTSTPNANVPSHAPAVANDDNYEGFQQDFAEYENVLAKTHEALAGFEKDRLAEQARHSALQAAWEIDRKKLQDEITDNLRVLDERDAKHQRRESELAEETRARENEANELREQLRLLKEEERTSSSEQVTQLEESLAQAKDEVETGARDLEALQQTSAKHKAELATSRERLVELEQATAKLEEAAAKHSQQLEEAQRQKEAQVELTGALTKDVERLTAALAKVESDLKTRDGELLSAKQDVDKSSREIAELQARITEATSERDADRNKFDAANREWQKERAELEERVAGLTSQIEDGSSAEQRSEGVGAILKQQQESWHAEQKILQSELDGATRVANEQASRLAQLEATIAQLRDEIAVNAERTWQREDAEAIATEGSGNVESCPSESDEFESAAMFSEVGPSAEFGQEAMPSLKPQESAVAVLERPAATSVGEESDGKASELVTAFGRKKRSLAGPLIRKGVVVALWSIAITTVAAILYFFLGAGLESIGALISQVIN